MQKRAFVLLSGGLDSTTCLYKAIEDFAPSKDWKSEGLNPGDWVEAVGVDYGQRHTKELDYAKGTCDSLGIKYTVLDVGNLLSGKTVMLTKEAVGITDVPDISYDEIKGVSVTYVPFRNGLMLSAITAHAQKYVNEQINQEAEEQKELARALDGDIVDLRDFKDAATKAAANLCGVYAGMHSEDAANWAYPDCTPEWIGAMGNAIYIGTYFCIRLHTPIQWLMKNEIVTLGDKLGVPFEGTWSCYKGEDNHCGTCPTCRSRKEAFKVASVVDPTVYAA